MSFTVGLVNMPFAAVDLPSIALTQLASVVEGRFGGRVETRIRYLNHDVYSHFGADLYNRLSASVSATSSGLGDFLFRPAAYPTVADDPDAYLKRYSWVFAADPGLRGALLREREGLDELLDRLIDEHGLEACDVVGFTSMFAQTMASIAVARKLKERRPEIVVVMGGANCETSMGGVLARHVGAVDYVFSGPALRSFPELVGRLEGRLDGRRGGEDPDLALGLKGVMSRGQSAGSESVGDELDIDEVVRLDYQSYFDSLDQRCPDVSPSLLFETSRGCWWGERAHCTFCGLNGTTMSYRSMKPEPALAQFRELFAHYPRVRHFKSVDNILPREYFTDVLPHVRPPDETVTIFYEIKADVSGEDMETLARAGVTELQPGIEALDTRTLKLMKKGTTAHQNVSFLKQCKRLGIRPIWNLLVGFPGEEESVYERYVRVLPSLVHLPPPTGVYPVRFDRYSPYFTRAAEYGLELTPYAFYELLYPFPPEELARMAYFFSDSSSGAYMETTSRWLGRLEASVSRWNERSRSRGGPARLELVSRDGVDTVVDSRDGTEVRHELEPSERVVLEALAKPTRLDALAEALPPTAAPRLEATIDRFRALGLLFEEGARAMSLVVESSRDEGFL